METPTLDGGGVKVVGKRSESDKTVIKSAYDSPKFKTDYPKGLEVPFTFDVYENDAAALQSLQSGELVKLVNARLKSNARSAAIAKATEPYKPDPNSPEQRWARMVDDATKGNPKLTREQIVAQINMLLGLPADYNGEVIAEAEETEAAGA